MSVRATDLPVFDVRSGLPGTPRLAVSVPVRGGQDGLRGPDAVVRLPVARAAALRTVSARQ